MRKGTYTRHSRPVKYKLTKLTKDMISFRKWLLWPNTILFKWNNFFFNWASEWKICFKTSTLMKSQKPKCSHQPPPSLDEIMQIGKSFKCFTLMNCDNNGNGIFSRWMNKIKRRFSSLSTFTARVVYIFFSILFPPPLSFLFLHAAHLTNYVFIVICFKNGNKKREKKLSEYFFWEFTQMKLLQIRRIATLLLKKKELIFMV